MLGRFALCGSLIALALIPAITTSCGSSTPITTKGCTSGPFDVVGPWRITVNNNGVGSVDGYGGIDSAGVALFFDMVEPTTAGDSLQLPIITGVCSVSGNITAYTEPGSPNGGSVISDAMQGNVTSSTAIGGTFRGNPSGTVSAVLFSKPVRSQPAPGACLENLWARSTANLCCCRSLSRRTAAIAA